jgi:hypothetical protein
MTALLDSDVRFWGWRYATCSEVESLFTDAGISPLLCCSAENIAAVTNLQALLGVTARMAPIPPNPFTSIASLGYYGPPDLSISPPQAKFDLLEILIPLDGAPVAGVQLGLSQPLDFASLAIGSYLVRRGISAVPEPSSGILLLSGVVIICFVVAPKTARAAHRLRDTPWSCCWGAPASCIR